MSLGQILDPAGFFHDDPVDDPVALAIMDPLNLGGNKEQKYDIQSALWKAGDGDDIGRGLGRVPGMVDSAKQAAIDKAKAEHLRMTLEDANFEANKSTSLTGTESLQRSIGDRLDVLRAGRGASVAAKAQPGLQRVAEQTGLARRGIQGEGSRASAQRATVGVEQAIANQQIEAQALGEQMQTEAGVQQLETGMTAFFNEMAANRFSREISGLTEEMNKWLSEQGAKIGYDQLAAESRQATMEMIGRFTSQIGREVARSDRPQSQPGSIDYSGMFGGGSATPVAGDAYQPSQYYYNR